jgi:arylsulfatase A-like enzyme
VNQQQHSHLYWDFNEQGGKRAVLRWPWKLIHLNTGAVDRAAKNQGKRGPLTKELYHLERDPGEEDNVLSQHPEIVAELEKLMADSYRAP